MIDLKECLIEVMKFGYIKEENRNIDLIIFSHPSYFLEPNNKFIVFEINNN